MVRSKANDCCQSSCGQWLCLGEAMDSDGVPDLNLKRRAQLSAFDERRATERHEASEGLEGEK